MYSVCRFCIKILILHRNSFKINNTKSLNMKKIVLNFILSTVLIFSVVGCGEKKVATKPSSSGKTLEMLVVAGNSVYSGSTKEALKEIFASPHDGLNQPEPRFDMVQIAPSTFDGNSMFQSHRNILILEVNPQNINKVYLARDKWSLPQVVIRITARDRNSLDSMLSANSERLLKEYYAQEYRRMEKVFSQRPDVKIVNYIKEKHGITMAVDEEFALAKMHEDYPDFTWVLKQTKDFDLHLLIHTRQPGGDSDFDEAVILNNLDSVLHRYVPGPSEGSYPGVERRDFFYTRNVMLGDINAVETRGLWRTYNDFMGGPFVCYTFLSPDGLKLYTLLGFVYSPSERNSMVMKRDLLMQVDGMCRSVKF